MMPPQRCKPGPHTCAYQAECERLRQHNHALMHHVKRLELDLSWKRSTHHNAPLLTGPPPKRTRLSSEGLDAHLLVIFAGLKTIDDIVALKHINCSAEMMGNLKMQRLQKLIPALSELTKLVGLKAVKSTIFDLVCFYTQTDPLHYKDEMTHLVIEGPPGVGKTAVGRCIGKIMLSLGLVSTGQFVAARRSDLVGEYMGQTAPRTQAMIDKAIGGVLFLDEAYALGNSEKRDQFSKECIDTLNQNLTDRRGEFVCIVAGYKEELQSCFFAINRGLERRFPIRLSIEGYTGEELFSIFEQLAKDKTWTLHQPEVSKKFIIQKLKHFHFFAGDMETLLQKSKFVALTRIMGTTTIVLTEHLLEPSDIKNAYDSCFIQREELSIRLPFMYS